MLLSIIIPMYNVSHFLEKCVNCVSLEGVDYELLMINDGSPDNSLEVANQLSFTNNCIKVYSQENKGLGGARNLGIRKAKGKYIVFLDVDDILMLKDFIFLKNADFEIMELSANRIDIRGKLINRIVVNNSNDLNNGIDYYLNNYSINSACNKIYLTDFLRNKEIYFKEQIYSEDLEFNTRAFALADKVLSKDLVLQSFVNSSDSITRNNDKNRKIKLINDYVSISKSIRSFQLNNCFVSDDTIKYFNKKYTSISVDVIIHSLINNLGIRFCLERLKILRGDSTLIFSEKLDSRPKDCFRRICNIIFRIFG